MSEYKPDIAIHPGKTLCEAMETINVSIRKMSLTTCMSEDTIEGIIVGRKPITRESAIALAKFFGMSVEFWINLQKNYDETVRSLKNG